MWVSPRVSDDRLRRVCGAVKCSAQCMHVLERICIFCLRLCIMSQSQLRESASVFPHRVFSGVCAVFQCFCQCSDSQTFVLYCRPDEASPCYEKGFSGQPKSLFRAVIRCFLWCGGGVSGMRESLSDSAGKCFQCSGCIIIRILYTSDSFSVPVLRKCFVMIFYCPQMYNYAVA